MNTILTWRHFRIVFLKTVLVGLHDKKYKCKSEYLPAWLKINKWLFTVKFESFIELYGCGDHAQRYKVYRLVAVSLFATFALFCLQLLSIVFLDANKNKLLLLLLRY